jgi:NAD(P)-dependent dehydrogenase (short-subunit alcohol dehydrogenase family)
MTFEYKHAFITGAAGGIGLGIADALAKRGVNITVADIDQDAMSAVLHERPANYAGVMLDIQNRDQWQSAKAMAEKRFGPVDILVNNAGITMDGVDLADIKPESFDRMISIDLVGVFNGISTFAADMRHRKKGHIVNTASVMGLLSGASGMGSYAAAKAGVIALSEALRQELEPAGVGVSVLCPGFVASRLRETSKRVMPELKNQNLKSERQPMDALVAGEIVLRGIEKNRAYIFTHKEYLQSFERRSEAVRIDMLRSGADAQMV